MKKTYKVTVGLVLVTSLLGACGQSSEEPSPSDETIEQQDSVEDTLLQIVEATCSDLRYATSQAEAAKTLSYAMQLAESIGVTNTQLGSYLSAACQDAINDANQLP